MFSVSVAQLFFGPLVSCGRWLQINTVGHNGQPREVHLFFSISKVKHVPEPLTEVKGTEEEMWVDTDGRGAAAPWVVRQKDSEGELKEPEGTQQNNIRVNGTF